MTATEMHSQHRGEAIYTAEVDVHFPQLTVGDTLTFAARARQPRVLPQGLNRNDFANHLRDVVMAMFGISHTVNTRVGNEYVRGVSGGERKRVTISEAALSGASLQCWDNSTRGLDSANAIEFCKILRLQTELFNSTACVSIYQSPQSAYDLFDKAVVLYEGRQIFFGRADAAKQYFISLGFDCPARQTTPDFLTSMTSDLERILRPGFEGKAPRTPDEFAAAWKNSTEYEALQKEMEEYKVAHPIDGPDAEAFRASKHAQQAKGQRKKSPFTLSYAQQIQLCLWRGWRRLAGDPSLSIGVLIGNFAMALVIGSVFYNLSDTSSSFFQRGALLFFACMMNAFASALEVSSLNLTSRGCTNPSTDFDPVCPATNRRKAQSIRSIPSVGGSDLFYALRHAIQDYEHIHLQPDALFHGQSSERTRRILLLSARKFRYRPGHVDDFPLHRICVPNIVPGPGACGYPDS